MGGQDGFPSRRRAPRGRLERNYSSSVSAGRREQETTTGVTTRHSLDVASYVSDMTAQLEAMALAAGLDLLAYFLGMAKSEADLFVRTNAESEGGASESGSADGMQSDEGQADFHSTGG
jgi:hypothetical protein